MGVTVGVAAPAIAGAGYAGSIPATSTMTTTPRVNGRWKAGWNHGTASGYSNHYCRCIPCTDAYNEVMRKYRSWYGRLGVHGPRPYSTPTHGTHTEYAKHGCRCDLCRIAERDYRRSYRAQRKALAGD